MNDELNEFLFRHGLAARGAAIAWTPLPGGVASDIWRVDVPPRSLCVKRALGTLKVAANWQVPTTRNAYEWAWIRYASLHAPGAVPAPLAYDAAFGMFAMEFLDPAAYPNWKQLLLQGTADAGTAAAVAKLLANAGSHTAPRLPIEIDAEYTNDHLLISVSDRGPGIPIEATERLFEKFYRGDDRKTGGLGLGLSIARGLIEAHGGRLTAENRDGGGARFTIRLPVSVTNMNGMEVTA